MPYIQIIGFVLLVCTVWFYFGTPCKDSKDASTLKRLGCTAADSAATLGQLLPEIVHTGLAYLIISGVLGGLGAVGSSVLAFAKLKKKWTQQSPEGAIGQALDTVQTELKDTVQRLERQGESEAAATAAHREQLREVERVLEENEASHEAPHETPHETPEIKPE